MKKIIKLFETVCENKYFPLVLILIAFLFLSFFSTTTSPFFSFGGMDSAVFKTMGQALLKGKVLYRDIFDHKGPYLYVINAFGQWLIPGRMGIFLLQVMALSIALLYMFKTAKLFVSSSIALMSVLLALFILGGCLEGGNLCEEWMMYAICISFYYVCLYFVKKNEQEHPLHYSLIYGLCFGFSFFIRPNDAVAWVGGIIMGVVLWLLYRKKYKNAMVNTLCFLCGFFVMMIPVLIYFCYNEAISDLWFGLIGFNQEYSGGINEILSSCFKWNKLFLFFFFVIFIWLLYDTPNKKILFFIVPAFLMHVLLMGPRAYLHYSICMIFFWLLFFTFFLLKLRKTYWVLLIVPCLLIYNIGFLKTIRPSVMKWNMFGHQAVYKQADMLFAFVPVLDKDSIWNYGLSWEAANGGGIQSEFSIFCHLGIVPCNKITFAKNKQLEDEDRVHKHYPKWIILQQKEISALPRKKEEVEDSLFIISHYDIVAKSDTSICKLILYKRI